MTNIVTRTLAHDECQRLDDAEKQPVKGWRNLYFVKGGPIHNGITVFSSFDEAVAHFKYLKTPINQKANSFYTPDGWRCKYSDLLYAIPFPVGE